MTLILNYLAVVVFLGMAQVYMSEQFIAGIAIGLYVGLAVVLPRAIDKIAGNNDGT